MIKRLLAKLQSWARHLKSEIYALYVAMRDPRTPLYVRYIALFVIGYALSPIDLIPDFIPVIGLLDDLILIPAAIALLRHLIPPVVMVVARRQAAAMSGSGLPASRNAAITIMAIWALVITASLWWFANRLTGPRSTTVDTNPIQSDQIPSDPGSAPVTQSPDAQSRDRSRDRN